MTLKVVEERMRTWTQFTARLATRDVAGQWFFRGGLEGRPLETSLERAFRDWDLPLSGMPRVERRLLREFKRAYQISGSTNAPNGADTLGWLALMQQHGAPTRLLDWTYSPYVAAFFAMEALLSHRGAGAAVVWALPGEAFADPARLVKSKRIRGSLARFDRSRDGRSFAQVFLRKGRPQRFVYPVNPARLNQRLVIQQGLFLCATDVTCPFEESLRRTGQALRGLKLVRFVLPRSTLRDAILSLQRMNMNPASLFPGLDGYARNLKVRLRFISDADLREEIDV